MKIERLVLYREVVPGVALSLLLFFFLLRLNAFTFIRNYYTIVYRCLQQTNKQTSEK